jgi:hypothetical protein
MRAVRNDSAPLENKMPELSQVGHELVANCPGRRFRTARDFSAAQISVVGDEATEFLPQTV